ncbi:MAG TPA: YggT family protein [Candidatus Hydrogenedentes bacterium]|nr:YggT family protein [Candidatus Hydrogenedentota bacterium]HOL78286.1 YggT family protein [Candidatus Hydrogenedentota bacterium]HPO87453.1 YggT family protein [Candidatus Hydrogenedentota bacterium]
MSSVWVHAVVIRGLYCVFTLLMLAVLLRWFGPWLQLDVESGRLRWISRLTDPLIYRIRRLLPPMGTIDLAPFFTLLMVWFIRQIAVWGAILILKF